MAKRVYFAFDYEDVSDFRANVVRNHNFTGGIEKAGYMDASIWEEAKKKDPTALKRLINRELENTSVTVVLIGTGTWARRWVRYEIIKSIERGNKVIGIHINNISGKNQETKTLGADPFDYLGIRFSSEGKLASPIEFNGTTWIDYSDLAAFNVPEQSAEIRGKSLKLSEWLPVYDWALGSGFKNFSSWIS